MNFGQAIEAAKAGKCVKRSGWNGKNMFVYLNEGSFPNNLTVKDDELVGGISFKLFQYGSPDTALRMPNLNLRAADGSTVTGWLASQTDMLAEDWEIAR